jgi:prepilin-type N-terminal cleavage/methylation domain-containing protein
VIKKFFKKTKKNLQAGFSLLEMVMVLAIFGLLTAVVTYNYGAFNNQITLTNLAYEIAMQVREAQVYSLGVRGSNNTFDSRYGVYFKAGQGSFISFVDKEIGGTADGVCDNSTGSGCDACTGQTECQRIISLPRNMTIERFLNSSNGNPITGPVFITFKRPDTEAILYNGSSPISSGVDIIIRSPDLQYKKVTVKQNGYISVGDYTP